MTKISALTPLGDDLAVGDQFIIRDISDAGTPNKSVTISGITRGLEVGTALAPSIAFAADKNTGIYGTGSDVLALVTAGENRLHITSGGLVGIGTSSPNKLLHIYGGASDTEIRLQSNSGTEQNAYFTLRNSGGKLDIYSVNGDIALNPGNSVAATFKSDGKVGIGTTSPSTLLHLSGSACFLTLNATTANSNNIVFQVNSSTKAYIGLAGNLGGSDNDLGFRAESGNNQVFYIGAGEKARIDSSGRLLVGTTNSDGAPSSGAIIQLANQFSVRAVEGGGVTNQRASTASATTLNCVIDVPIGGNNTSSFIGSLYISQQLTNSEKSFLAEYRVKIHNAGSTAVFTLVDSVDDSSPNNVALTFTYSNGNRQITVTSTWTTATSSTLGCNLIGAGTAV